MKRNRIGLIEPAVWVLFDNNIADIAQLVDLETGLYLSSTSATSDVISGGVAELYPVSYTHLRAHET